MSRKRDHSGTGELIAMAIEAARAAYAPYSGFHVGAALRTADGACFPGCNVENASYGLTICAERAAVFSAVAAGRRRLSAMAIAADGPALPYPCGACRQVLAEFAEPDFTLFVARAAAPDAFETLTLAELLPKTFKLAGPTAPGDANRAGRNESDSPT